VAGGGVADEGADSGVEQGGAEGGDLTRTLEITPFVSFTKLDVVGVVVQGPQKDPRDTVLPEKKQPKPTPTVTVTVTPGADPDGQAQDGQAQDGLPQDGGTGQNQQSEQNEQ
jgi:rod shape-determining protein MreC